MHIQGRVWLNIYPCIPTTTPGLRCGSLTCSPRSWLNSFRIMWRSSIFLRVFRMAWKEQLCVREEDDSGLGSCFCQAKHTSLNLLIKRRCNGSDCNTAESHRHTYHNATVFEQSFIETTHSDWNNVPAEISWQCKICKNFMYYFSLNTRGQRYH